MGALNIERRRSHLLQHTTLSARFLEIGAYDQPTLHKHECDVRYLDHQTREQLLEPLTDAAQRAAIPETDYVVGSDNYTDWVDEQFDVVVANHVFEHVPDPIGWLRTVNAMLVEDGILFLALPDKKYTFDRFRQDTAFSHVLHDWFAGPVVATREHLLEDAMYYDLGFIGEPMRIEERLDEGRLRAVMSRTPHLGLHCHVFQSETFRKQILAPILFMKLVRFDIAAFHPAADNFGEFMVVLRKRDPRVALATDEFFTTDFETAPTAVARSTGGRIRRWLAAVVGRA